MVSFNSLHNYKTIELFRIELSFISIFTVLSQMLTKEDDPSRTTSNDNIKITLK